MAKKKPDMTPDQRAKQKIIDSIRALTHYKAYTLGQIEKTLGLPQNSLSGMLNGSRNMSPKWQKLLSEFIKALPKEDKTITIKIGEVEPEPEKDPVPTEIQPTQPELEKVEDLVAAPKTAPAKKFPPPGLSRSQLNRWFRENNQTLV